MMPGGDLYGRVFQTLLYPAWETGIRRRPTLEHLRFLEKSQWQSLDRLRAMQLGFLRHLLAHAANNVPYYRALFRRESITPASIRTLEDFARVPLLTRPLAREAGADRASAVAPLPTITKNSSGTSGTPLSFAYDRGSEHWRQAVKLRGYAWAGHLPGVRTLHYWGVLPSRTKPSAFTTTKISLERRFRRDLYVNCASRSEEDMARAVEAIAQFRPQAIIAYSLAGGDLARYVLDRGLRSWGDIPVLCAGEPLYPEDREALRRAFGPHVFNTYGCREVMLIGTECSEHDGLHTSMENLVIELVVREAGGERPARPGEVGEVVITDLHNYGMPFIRYLNGDLAVAGPEGTCRCGRALERLAGVEGRETDTLRDARGARVSGMVFIVAVATVGHAIKQWQGVQHVDGSITFYYVPGPGFDDAIPGHLQRAIEKYFGGLRVTMRRTEDIPVGPNGKRRVVVVEREAAPARPG